MAKIGQKPETLKDGDLGEIEKLVGGIFTKGMVPLLESTVDNRNEINSKNKRYFDQTAKTIDSVNATLGRHEKGRKGRERIEEEWYKSNQRDLGEQGKKVDDIYALQKETNQEITNKTQKINTNITSFWGKKFAHMKEEEEEKETRRTFERKTTFSKIIDVIKASKAKQEDLKKKGDSILAKFGKFFGKAGAIIKLLAIPFTFVFKKLFSIGGPILKFLVSPLRWLFKKLFLGSKFKLLMVGAIGAGIYAYSDKISGFIRKMVDKVDWDKVFGWAFDKIMFGVEIITKLANKLGEYLAKVDWGGIWDKIKEPVGKALGGLFDAIMVVGAPIWEAIKSGISMLWSKFWESPGTHIANFVSVMWTGIWSALSNPGAVLAFAGGAVVVGSIASIFLGSIGRLLIGAPLKYLGFGILKTFGWILKKVAGGVFKYALAPALKWGFRTILAPLLTGLMGKLGITTALNYIKGAGKNFTGFLKGTKETAISSMKKPFVASSMTRTKANYSGKGLTSDGLSKGLPSGQPPKGKWYKGKGGVIAGLAVGTGVVGGTQLLGSSPEATLVASSATNVGLDIAGAVARRKEAKVAKKVAQEATQTVSLRAGSAWGKSASKNIAEKASSLRAGSAWGKNISKEIAEKAGKSVTKKVLDTTGEIIAKKTILLTSKAVAKGVVKKIPLVGIGAGAVFAANRLWNGDLAGAAMEVYSGLISTIPYFGTIASAAIDYEILKRDLTRLSNTMKLDKQIENLRNVINENVLTLENTADQFESITSRMRTRLDKILEDGVDKFDVFRATKMQDDFNMLIKNRTDYENKILELKKKRKESPDEFTQSDMSFLMEYENRLRTVKGEIQDQSPKIESITKQLEEAGFTNLKEYRTERMKELVNKVNSGQDVTKDEAREAKALFESETDNRKNNINTEIQILQAELMKEQAELKVLRDDSSGMWGAIQAEYGFGGGMEAQAEVSDRIGFIQAKIEKINIEEMAISKTYFEISDKMGKILEDTSNIKELNKEQLSKMTDEELSKAIQENQEKEGEKSKEVLKLLTEEETRRKKEQDLKALPLHAQIAEMMIGPNTPLGGLFKDAKESSAMLAKKAAGKANESLGIALGGRSISDLKNQASAGVKDKMKGVFESESFKKLREGVKPENFKKKLDETSSDPRIKTRMDNLGKSMFGDGSSYETPLPPPEKRTAESDLAVPAPVGDGSADVSDIKASMGGEPEGVKLSPENQAIVAAVNGTTIASAEKLAEALVKTAKVAAESGGATKHGQDLSAKNNNTSTRKETSVGR